MRASTFISTVAGASIPFILLGGVWMWKQSDETDGPSRPVRPSSTVSTSSTASPATTAVVPVAAKTVAESVLSIYLANPSPATTTDLAKLHPLVSDTIYQRIAGEWEGSTTRAVPRLESLRSITVDPLPGSRGVKYSAEAVQLVDFPEGQDEHNTLSVSMRLTNVNGAWIVIELSVF